MLKHLVRRYVFTRPNLVSRRRKFGNVRIREVGQLFVLNDYRDSAAIP